MKENEEVCSFCGREKSEVKNLIAGPSGSYICDECIEICQEILKENSVKLSKKFSLLKPQEIKAKLDDYVTEPVLLDRQTHDPSAASLEPQRQRGRDPACPCLHQL